MTTLIKVCPCLYNSKLIQKILQAPLFLKKEILVIFYYKDTNIYISEGLCGSCDMPIISGSVVSPKFFYDLFPSGFVHNLIVVQQCACPH